MAFHMMHCQELVCPRQKLNCDLLKRPLTKLRLNQGLLCKPHHLYQRLHNLLLLKLAGLKAKFYGYGHVRPVQVLHHHNRHAKGSGCIAHDLTDPALRRYTAMPVSSHDVSMPSTRIFLPLPICYAANCTGIRASSPVQHLLLYIGAGF